MSIWNPWHDLVCVRRLRFAWAFREWPWNVPDSVVQNVSTRRPPEHVFEFFRKLHGLDDSSPGGAEEGEGA